MIHIVSAFTVFEDFYFFELEAIPSWYRLLESRMNRLSNSDVRITFLQAFSFQRSNNRSIQVKHPIKRNITSLKNSINSESHFNSAFTYVGQNPFPRLNAYFSYDPTADVKLQLFY